DEILMMPPPPAAAMSGIACLQPRNGPSRLTALTQCHCSSVVVSTLPRTPTPALLTSVSRWPKARTAAARLATHCSSLRTSCARKIAASPISFATAPPREASTSAIATRAPFAAKAIAMARPRPEAAPVMKAALPARRPLAMRSSSSARQVVILEHLAQPRLQHLAGRAMRHFRDEDDVIGQLPFRDLGLEEPEDRFFARVLARLRDDDQQRPLRPFRMRQADHRRLCDIGMAHRDVLDIDRADPFAAGFDHILGAVDDLHIAIGIDGRDVAGAEPPLLIQRGRGRFLVIVICADHPRTAYQKLAARDAVMRLRP